MAGPVSFGAVTPSNFAIYSVDWQPVTVGSAGALQYIEATYASGFSAFGLVSNPAVPLPVELLEFSGVHVPGKGNLLSWRTAQERDNARFEIESSRDGLAFRQNGSRAASGTSDKEQQYTYLDASPEAGTTYYRLRQVDTDGAHELSATVAVTASKSAANPLVASLRTAGLTVTNELDLERLVLLDGVGRTVSSWERIAPGRHDLALSVALVQGSYYLSCTATDGTEHTLPLVVR